MSGQLLTKTEVAALCKRIKAASDDTRLTWDKVVAWALEDTGRSFTRQALYAHKAIGKAYRESVKAYRNRRRTGRPEKLSDETRDQRTKRLLAEENESLRSSLAEYDRRLQAVVAHCALAGVDVRRIDLLPRMNRAGPPKSMR